MYLTQIKNSHNTSFKARFSNDAQTVSILKDRCRCNNSPAETKMMIDVLKSSGTDDVISLEQWDDNTSGTARNLKITCRNADGETVSTKYSHIGSLFEGIMNLRLSDNSLLNDLFHKFAKIPRGIDQESVKLKLEAQYEKDTKLNRYTKLIMEQLDEIASLRTEKENESNEYIEEYIDENI